MNPKIKDTANAFLPYPFVALKHADKGKLSGLTFAVKDLFDVAGYPTSSGNPHILAMSGIKTKTAPIVQKLLDAGAEFVGKTHTCELAFSMSGHNIHFGTPINGGAPDCIPGGSSSGSAAAVSNHLCDFAIGTDTGGSVRTPASYCGLFGIRPTHGRVSLELCQPLAPSMDTCGFLAADINTFEKVGEVFLGEDSYSSKSEVALIWSSQLMKCVPNSVIKAMSRAYKHLENSIGKIEISDTPVPDFEKTFNYFLKLQTKEAWQSQGKNILDNHLVLGHDVMERFKHGINIDNQEYAEATKYREKIIRFWDKFLGVKILVMPTVPSPAPLRTASEEDVLDIRRNAQNLLTISVLTGRPQITLPMYRYEGKPMGISLLGPEGSDRLLIAIAKKAMRSYIL